MTTSMQHNQQARHITLAAPVFQNMPSAVEAMRERLRINEEENRIIKSMLSIEANGTIQPDDWDMAVPTTKPNVSGGARSQAALNRERDGNGRFADGSDAASAGKSKGSRPGVHRRARRGGDENGTNQERVVAMLKASDENTSYRQVGEQLGVSQSLVAATAAKAIKDGILSARKRGRKARPA